MRKIVGLAGRIVAVFILSTALILGSSVVATKVWAEDKPVEIVLLPASVTGLKVDDTFALTIQVQPNGQNVSAVDACLNFTPAYLEVVDVEPDLSELDMPLMNNVSNALGQIDCGAGSITNSPSTTFTLATITFRVKAVTSGTAVIYSRAVGRKTMAAYASQDYLDKALGALISTEEAVSLPPEATQPTTQPTPPTVTSPPPVPEPISAPPPTAEPTQPTAQPTAPSEEPGLPAAEPTAPSESTQAPEEPATPTGEPVTSGLAGVAWWVWLIIGVVVIGGLGGYFIARRV